MASAPGVFRSAPRHLTAGRYSSARVTRRGIAALATVGAGSILAAATPAGAGPPDATRAAEDEGLVSYVTAGKLRPKKRIAYGFVCSQQCQATAGSTLVLKGPNLGPAVDTGMFAAGEIAEAFLKPNKAARGAIKSHIGAARLRTSIMAITAAGVTDTDTRTFRFRR